MITNIQSHIDSPLFNHVIMFTKPLTSYHNLSYHFIKVRLILEIRLFFK